MKALILKPQIDVLIDEKSIKKSKNLCFEDEKWKTIRLKSQLILVNGSNYGINTTEQLPFWEIIIQIKPKIEWMKWVVDDEVGWGSIATITVACFKQTFFFHGTPQQKFLWAVLSSKISAELKVWASVKPVWKDIQKNLWKQNAQSPRHEDCREKKTLLCCTCPQIQLFLQNYTFAQQMEKEFEARTKKTTKTKARMNHNLQTRICWTAVWRMSHNGGIAYNDGVFEAQRHPLFSFFLNISMLTSISMMNFIFTLYYILKLIF